MNYSRPLTHDKPGVEYAKRYEMPQLKIIMAAWLITWISIQPVLPEISQGIILSSKINPAIFFMHCYTLLLPVLLLLLLQECNNNRWHPQ
jgi:hypothetical protein